MIKATLIFSAAVISLVGSVAAQTKLGLAVNNELVVAKGQLKNFSYDVGSRKVQIETFFGDIRCETGPQSGAGDPIVVEIDKFSGLESAAAYDVFSGGAVEYRPSENLVNISMADTSQALGCTHHFPAVGSIVDGEANPGAFWVSDFGSPLAITSDSEITSDSTAGTETLTVEFTVTNVSKVLVATCVELELQTTHPALILSDFATVDPVLVDGICPDPANTHISILVPEESRKVSVAYDLSGVQAGEIIDTSIADVLAQNRIVNAPLGIGNIGVTVQNTAP